MAAGQYAADYASRLGSPHIVYRNIPTYLYTAGCPEMPALLRKKFGGNVFTTQATHYLALEYIPIARTYQKQIGNNVLTCPSARANLQPIYPQNWGRWGSTEFHYFFSDLIQTPHPTVEHPRTNTWGPYKVTEIAKPAETFFSGDAMAYLEMESTYPGYPAAMYYRFSADHIGLRSMLFGAQLPTSNYSDPTYPPAPPNTHRDGVNGLFWDAHAAAVMTPQDTPSERARLRRQFSANYSGAYVAPPTAP